MTETATWWTGGRMTPALERALRCIPGFDAIATREECTYDIEAGQRAVDFIEECCSHTKGELAGQRVHLEEWERAIVLNAFGWMRPDGRRRFREVLLFIPRKNGKTLLCACIALYMFFCDHEAGAEIYAAAAEREQATLVWGMAKQMTIYEPELRKRCKVYNALRSMENPADGSYFKPLSRDALTKHGFNAHAVVFDELHTQKNNEMIEVLETSMGARRQPMIWYLTTSDYERENSPCNEKHEYASKVRDGIVKDMTFLPVIYEAKETDDWTDPEVWKKANPNLGTSVSMEYLAKACKRAQEVPSYQNNFKRLHLNIRTRQDVKWLDTEAWKACGEEEVNIEDLVGQKAYGGLDLASTSDLCAFVLWFPDQEAVLCWFWLPEDTASKRKEKARVPYPRWGQEGHIRLTPGNVADYDQIREDIKALRDRFDIRQIAVDRWNSTQLQTQLAGDGFDIMPFGQGFASMTAPAKELERRVMARKLKHGNHPVLAWCASNVMIEIDSAGNIKPSKKKSTEKIDGIVSLTMAIGSAMLSDDGSGPSIYEQQGITFL